MNQVQVAVSPTAPLGRPIKRSLAWLAFLGPLFYITYGFANYLATQRTNVPSIVFEWERSIPFVAWTIYPYWTINAFYAISIFLARDKLELDRHGLRLLAAQIVAVTCFIAFPLGFSFGQPQVTGAPALLFDALRGFDKPFNQAPSLHITLAVILWDFYQRRIQSSWGRVVLHLWTLAICVSVLTTYQHHFIDIPTGALLGVVCVWLFPLATHPLANQSGVAHPNLLRTFQLTTHHTRRSLSLRYALGAAGFAVLAIWLGGVALWLLWLSVALLIVSLNYLGFGAAGFQKGADGRVSWASRVLLWPYRFFAKLNVRFWTGKLPAANEVMPRVWLGRLPLPLFTDALAANSRTVIVDLTAEFASRHSSLTAVPTLDLVPFTAAEFEQAAAVIDQARSNDHDVLVCCALGFSRSAAALAYWMVTRNHAVDLADAVAKIHLARPQIVLHERWRLAVIYALNG
jgi:membrane-associated phospholipid phosphatase